MEDPSATPFQEFGSKPMLSKVEQTVEVRILLESQLVVGCLVCCDQLLSVVQKEPNYPLTQNDYLRKPSLKQ